MIDYSVTLNRAVAPSRSVIVRPALLGFLYLAATVIIFQFGPMRYPTEGRPMVLTFLVLCFACIWFGYHIGTGRAVSSTNLKNTNFYILVGGVLSILTLWPSADAYTGRSPFDVLAALNDQSNTYSGLAARLAETEGSRTGVVIMRMFTQPFAYAAIPLSIIFWNRGWMPKAAFFMATGSYLVFSILRGTDREVGDLIVLIGSASLVVMVRKQLGGQPRVKLPTNQMKKIGVLILALVIVTIAFDSFSSRKEGRLGSAAEFCMDASGACADYSNPLVALLPESQKFSATMATSYLTNGYYGLQLALQKPWEPMFGFGHSDALLRVYQLLSGDLTLASRSYNFRGVYNGWPSQFFWSSMVTSLANDVSFPGALILLVMLGTLWSRSWIAATYGSNDAAVVVFCLCMHTLFYFPANLQVLQTLDGYSTAVFWLIAWSASSRNRS
jgi:hypothetical protein